MGKVVEGEKTWPSWEDCRGFTYRPGDIIAVATVNGRSPQLVLARVERINRVNSSGELIETNQTFQLEEPIRHSRECSVVVAKRRNDRYYETYYRDHVCTPHCTEWIETTEVKTVPSCTVRATPIMDTRGFGRSRDHDGKVKAVTYSIPENILLVERSVDL